MISRPLDPGEAFFVLSDRVSSMNFVVFAQRSALLQPERITQALSALQHENALLQVRIDWSEAHGLRFEPAPGQAIQLHTRAYSADGWRHYIEQELSNLFAADSAPLLRCLYLEDAVASRSVLALTFHHSIADGRSGTALLRRLLSLLAHDQPTPAEPAATALPDSPALSASPALPDSPALSASTALPAMHDVFPPRYRWACQPDAVKALRNTLIGDYRRYGALSTIPWLATQANARTPQFIQCTLPAEISQSLLQRARAEGTTVHGALCAAQLLAQHQLQPPGTPSTFFLSCPVDMRPHLEPVQPILPTGLFVSLISNTFQISDDTALWTLARDVIAQTRLQLARGEGHLLYWLYGLTGAPVPPSELESFRKKSLASLPNTMVSNVGAIASVDDDPAVEAISFALCPMPYQTLFTAASSYRGCLILNVGFDAQRVQEQTAQTLVTAIDALLRRAAVL